MTEEIAGIPIEDEIPASARALALAIANKLDAISNPWEQPTSKIFRAPANVRELQRDVYEPTVLSIGPYNRGNPKLQAMEDQKWSCLHFVLSRGSSQNPSVRNDFNDLHFVLCGGPSQSQSTPLVSNGSNERKKLLETLVLEMKKLEKDARKCYADDVSLGSNDFVEMMLLDGCFIIFILRWSSTEGKEQMIGWNRRQVNADILKLENQIPFVVLQRLFGILHSTTVELVYLAMFYFSMNDLSKQPQRIKAEDTGKIDHLLHLYHLHNAPNYFEVESVPKIRKPTELQAAVKEFAFATGACTLQKIGSATGLIEAGVKINKKIFYRHFLDITFDKGTLTIPYLFTDPSYKAILANQLLFEESSNGIQKYWTAYAYFMDGIIDTPKDAAILTELGIVNGLSTADELATFFNQLAPSNTLDDTRLARYLNDLTNNVHEYCQSCWHRWMAKLKRDYFSNPWSVVSLVAAVVLLLLTIVQTFFSVLSYFRPPS